MWPINQGREILAAHRDGNRVTLTLDNGTRTYDHVMMATGYRTDVDKMRILDTRLREKIARHGTLPVLGGGMESSVRGLHFVGAAGGRKLWTAAALHCRRRLRRAQRHPRRGARSCVARRRGQPP